MHETDIKKLKFCRWMPWAGRSSLLQDDGPWLGVYLWARFHRAPSPLANPYPKLPRQVIYIGEAKNIDRRPLTGCTIDSFITGIPFRTIRISRCYTSPSAAYTGSQLALVQRRPEVSIRACASTHSGSRHRSTGSTPRCTAGHRRCIIRRAPTGTNKIDLEAV
jgi:hypothetical protein